MGRSWTSATADVALVAALSTGLVLEFLLPAEQHSWVITSGLFAVFTSLTAADAVIAFYRFRSYFEAQRKTRLAPGAGEIVFKEAVISHYRAEWGLSGAESDVALFVAKGFSNAEIAEIRGCAIATVKSQLDSIYQKSGLETRYQIIAFGTDEVCAIAQSSQRHAQGAHAMIADLPGNARQSVKNRAIESASKAQPMQRNATARVG